MEKVNLGEWHTKFRTEYAPELIFQECSDRDVALFAWSLYLLFQSVPLTDQPYRKKTGRFFINLQKKYFKTKYSQNITSERNILAYSLLIIIREFLRLEKLSEKDLRALIIFATGHYSVLKGVWGLSKSSNLKSKLVSLLNTRSEGTNEVS